MDNEKEIIKFEDLFESEHKPTQSDQGPVGKGRYSSAILVYLLIMFVFASVLFIALSGVPSLQKTYNEDEVLLENISYDTQSLAIMDLTIYDAYKSTYDNYIAEIGIYEGYAILTNINNTYYEALFMPNGETTINPTVIANVFSQNPTTTTWNGEIAIHLYAGTSQTLPDFFTGTYTEVTGPVTQFSDFANSLINFIIYIVLLPLLILVLKRDLVFDYQIIMKQKNRWASIIIIGYLYLMIGNALANLGSSALGNLFGVSPDESINQLTIIRALDSNGVIFMIVSAVILGPLVEEMIFRKSIFGLIKNDVLALIVSSLVFGSIHLVGEASVMSALVNGLSYFVMGAVFGLIYIQNKRNIYASLSVHILTNLVSVGFIIFQIYF